MPASMGGRSSLFQSTHPLGVRRNFFSMIFPIDTFQSTHPLGVRLVTAFKAPLVDLVSIHAPTRGATILLESQSVTQFCFNPRTHSGCDVNQAKFEAQKSVSIHAPTRGATLSPYMYSYSFSSFNPRTHSGCD